MTGTRHVRFTNLLTHLICNHVACNVLKLELLVDGYMATYPLEVE